MTTLHPSVTSLIPHLNSGLRVQIGDYSGLIRADAEGLGVEGDTFTETGKVRLTSPNAPVAGDVTKYTVADGPTIDHLFTVRGDAPGVELDLFVRNGEVEGVRTPHLIDKSIEITAPEGWSLIRRTGWGRVASMGAGWWGVNLPGPLIQGVLYTVSLALVPDSIAEDGFQWRMLQVALDTLPWLTEDGPGPVDGLPRYVSPFSSKVYYDVLRFIRTGEGLDEAEYLAWKYGAATGGMSIRFDFGAEFAALPAWMRYQLMHRWSHEIHARPQRGYLTRNGEPLEPEDTPDGFNMSTGPTKFIFPNKSSNPYGFDEDGLAAFDVKGSIDLQHGPRWFGPDKYLAETFDCPIAKFRLRAMAAAARCDEPDPRKIGKGLLGRGPGWNAVLQATAHHTDVSVVAPAVWLDRFVEVCERDQTEHGGLIFWFGNKEARDYARKYVWEQKPEADRPESYEGLPVEAVTQSYQETILAWALWCAGEVGVAVPEGLLENLVEFVCNVQRDVDARGPAYRTLPDGTRRSDNDSTFYHGAALALLTRVAPPDYSEIRDFTGNAPDPLAWLKAQKDKRNLHPLIAVLEGEE
jgi:hypothetical protein